MLIQTEKLTVRRVAGALGAVIEGVTLSGDLPDEVIEQILSALRTHKMIAFRGQNHLDDTIHAAFTARLGPPYEMPTVAGEGPKSGMYELDGSRPDGRAESWHTDSTFSLEPPAISVLRGVTIPEYGGDTTWANCVTAYESLPASLRDLADQLWVVHSNRFDLTDMRPNATADEIAHFEKVTTARTSITHHPMVHVHPVTGERALLLGKYAQRIVGFDAADSARIKDIFQSRVTQVANTVRWDWTRNDVVMWDNFATQHAVINDWGVQPRVVRRWTVAGCIPVSIDGKNSIAVRVP